MIVLDANVLIAYLDRRDAHHGAAVALLQSQVAEVFQASVITVAEALVHPARRGADVAAAAAFDAIGLETMPVSADSAHQLARGRAGARLKMPDTVVVELALRTGSTVATFDAALARAARAAGLEVLTAPESGPAPVAR